MAWQMQLCQICDARSKVLKSHEERLMPPCKPTAALKTFMHAPSFRCQLELSGCHQQSKLMDFERSNFSLKLSATFTLEPAMRVTNISKLCDEDQTLISVCPS